MRTYTITAKNQKPMTLDEATWGVMRQIVDSFDADVIQAAAHYALGENVDDKTAKTISAAVGHDEDFLFAALRVKTGRATVN